MTLVDQCNESLNEGDHVAVTLGGQLVPAQIARINAGLGKPGTPQAVPHLIVAFVLPFFPLEGTTVIPGVIKRHVSGGGDEKESKGVLEFPHNSGPST